MSAKPLRTRSKSASAERCLRPLGATIDMATPDPKTSNGFSVQGIFAWGFTKRQPGGRGGYRVLSLSGNCCPIIKVDAVESITGNFTQCFLNNLFAVTRIVFPLLPILILTSDT